MLCNHFVLHCNFLAILRSHNMPCSQSTPAKSWNYWVVTAVPGSGSKMRWTLLGALVGLKPRCATRCHPAGIQQLAALSFWSVDFSETLSICFCIGSGYTLSRHCIEFKQWFHSHTGTSHVPSNFMLVFDLFASKALLLRWSEAANSKSKWKIIKKLSLVVETAHKAAWTRLERKFVEFQHSSSV